MNKIPKFPKELSDTIRQEKELFEKIKQADNDISRMILITNFIVDYDTYYIDDDIDLHPNLWETVYKMLIK